YETHLSAIQTNAQATARFSRAHANERRTRHSRASSPTGTQATSAETRRAPFRAPHPGLSPSRTGLKNHFGQRSVFVAIENRQPKIYNCTGTVSSAGRASDS